jgi:hypothetical protein
MWTFAVRQGSIVDRDGNFVTSAYSGHGAGVNNPDMQQVPGVGPIPVGLYRIGAPFLSQNTGPYAMPLTPAPDTDTHGRADFELHGDLVGHEGQQLASHGCIIVDRPFRERIWLSGDWLLAVKADEADTNPGA